MNILDLQTGESHEYGTNTHDSLVVSEDGRTLNYYNLQNGDGSRFGDYRFIVGDEIERYWNIGGFAKPERKNGKWISLDDFRGKYNTCGYKCSECGEYSGYEENYCPNCGAKMESK